LSEEQCLIINREVQEQLPQVLGGNLLFGFVCGGVAKGYADSAHDIDTFACLETPIDEADLERYYQWYFDLHDRHGLPPDFDYPGEIVTLSQFEDTLRLLEGWKLTLHVTDIKLKKAIIWADMITGGIAARCGRQTEIIDRICQQYGHHPALWKEQILRLIPPDEVPLWQEKNHTLIMERYMKYPKYDGKKLQSRFGRKPSVEGES
jgi:hypothetical protein